MEYCLTDLCELIMGQSPDSSSCNKDGKGIPFYQGNADFGDKNPTPRNWCLQPKKIAKKDDILISVRAPIGDLNIANEECCIGRGVAAIRMKSKECNRYYLYLFLESKSKYLQDCGTGSTFTAINKGVLETLKVNCPELKNQISIANEIENIKTAIKYKNSELLCLNETVQSEFVEMFGDLDCNIKTIEQTCTMKSGTTFSKDEENDSGEIFYIKVSGMNLPENDKYIKTSLSFVSRKVAGKTIIPANSIIFPKRGGAIGTNKKRITEQEICIDLNTMAVTPSNELNIQYLYQYFQNLDMGKLYNGSTVPQINNKDIGPLKIKVPPLELQQQFAAFVQQIDKSKFVVKQQIADFQQLLDNKMQ